MALQIKALANGQLGTTAFGDLYTAPANKTAIIKNIRVVNTDSSARTMNLYFKRSGGTARALVPVNMNLAAGFLAVEEAELTIEAGDKIQGDASVASKLDYVISGVERDV